MPDRDSLLEQARQLDADDPLRRFRDQFYLPAEGVYLDGNSLGLLSRPAEQRLLKTLDEWRTLGIAGWMEADPPWYYLPEQLAESLAPLIGAAPDEVIVANSTSVNLHQVLATFYRPDGARAKVIVDAYAFPTDVYAIQSHVRLHGRVRDPAAHLLTVAAENRLIEEDAIVAALDEHPGQVALLVLPRVVYTTGQLLDLPRLTEAAHRHGALICIDASHSVGSVPHHFDDWDVDFAIWCNYKHLNAGPGALGGLYVNRRHLGTAPGLAGWYSSDKTRQFDMAPQPVFAADAGAYQIGTPQILSAAPLQASLEMFHAAGIEAVRTKSLRQTRFLMEGVDVLLDGMGFGVATPREDARRGAHVAVTHAEAARLNKALKLNGVVPDFRPPDIIRMGPVALYTGYADIAGALLTLHDIVERGGHLKLPNVRDVVA